MPNRPEKKSCCAGFEDLLAPKLFKALADSNRLTILVKMLECCVPFTVSQVATCCPVDISVVSRHLAVLRDAGILEAKKVGREVRYSVLYPQVVKTLRAIADAIETCCPINPIPEKGMKK